MWQQLVGETARHTRNPVRTRRVVIKVWIYPYLSVTRHYHRRVIPLRLEWEAAGSLCARISSTFCGVNSRRKVPGPHTCKMHQSCKWRQVPCVCSCYPLGPAFQLQFVLSTTTSFPHLNVHCAAWSRGDIIDTSRSWQLLLYLGHDSCCNFEGPLLQTTCCLPLVNIVSLSPSLSIGSLF